MKAGEGERMKYSELYQILRKARCQIEREGAGHTIWFSPISGRKFTVPRHKNEDVPKGTLNSILKAAGLKEG